MFKSYIPFDVSGFLLLLLFSQLCPALCDSTDYSGPGLPVPHRLPEFAQVHAHCIGDAVQSSHPLTPSSPSALNLFQHQGLFQWVICSHQITKILELQLQHQSFQWIFRADFYYDWLVWSPWCPRDCQKSHHSSKASILQHSAFFKSNSYIHTWLLEKPQL